MEPLRPDIFISATTRDLGPIRTLIKNALLDLGAHPIEQQHFAPAGKTVAAMLRERLQSCRAVIHLVGHCYGAEDTTSEAARAHRTYAEGRRSYTQLEHDLALELGKEIYVFLCGKNFPYTPHDPEPDELPPLQHAHRQRLLDSNHLWITVESEAELRDHLRKLEDRVKTYAEELQRERQRHRRTLFGVGAALLLLALGLWAVQGRTRHLEQHAIVQDTVAADLLARIAALEQQNQPNRAAVQATLDAKGAAGPRGDAGTQQVAAAADLGLTLDELRRRIAAADTNAEERVKLAEQLEQRAAADQQAARLAKRQALSDLADAARAAGHYREAIAHYRLASPLFDEEKEPAAWDKFHDALAVALKFQAQYEEAEALYRKILARRERSLPPDAPDLATSLNNLAQLYRATNRQAEAEPMLERALKIQEKNSGPEHPVVAIYLHNLADLYQDTSRLAEAESLLVRALKINEKTYGLENPNVARDLTNLAQLYQDTNRLAEAEPLMKRSLKIDEKSYGPEHPTVGVDLSNLARLYQDTNRLAEAEPLIKRSLKIAEQNFGPAHPKVAIRLNKLGQLYQETNRQKEAEPLIKRALNIAEQSFGREHSDVAIYLKSLARLYQATNREAEAEPLFRRALWIWAEFQRRTGHPHPAFEIGKENYATFLRDQQLPEDEIARRVASAQVEKPVVADKP